ncbi:TetR/AcrR family transcriptional regulator C-terminal domain-containing protein [Arthrobacter glacialis]|uniref:TetR family transcriptional regulator n=1 Tax=Arthrobacter glacialis TaxID=1664 RepID=A0A2S3ZTM9_ARTGL|nr:TetR/AcrR family transcriptional regulator C-terminal domain-containing protein [Arthrobacter glacialis]POH72616.1 TetR family transcriptional regulator [Arthrobacter glacialis]
MALTREQIVDAAMAILRDYGLADLSMRRLARDLDVQPGALYWHIKNKQDLLTVLAGMILEPVGQAGTLRGLALAIRRALLSVRDGAEVVALAHALAPDAPSPMLHLRQLMAVQGLSAQEVQWAADALIHFILGAATQEQTRAGLARAGLVGQLDDGADAAFEFGLGLFLAGLARS